MSEADAINYVLGFFLVNDVSERHFQKKKGGGWDKGKGFDESKVKIPKIEEKIGSDHKRGWGLQLIKELMDTVEFESSSEGTTVTMTKKK